MIMSEDIGATSAQRIN